jgi:nucleotidyltransferase/DNA polymerase involved in DNA repair
MKDSRKLSDLVSVGPAPLKDFTVVGIKTVRQLARSKPTALDQKLCGKTGQKHDRCALDVFTATVAQAKNPKLPLEKCHWWHRSKVRKQPNLKEGRP